MVPETEINELNDQVVDYLRNQFWGCGDINTARLVLDKLRDHFVEPEYWLGLRRYVAQVLYREWRKEDPGGIVGKRGGGAEEDTPGVAVDVAVIQLKADGLPATRSTLYRWADQGEIDAVRDDDKDRLWLTPKGLAEARERLQWKALTTYQRDGMGKDSEAARKFTYRHQKRGDTPQDTASVLRVGRDGL